jgi:hypothetical protein
MPHPTTPPQHTLRGLAARKRLGAERREQEAARMRAEADELDRRWADYCAGRDARKAAS